LKILVSDQMTPGPREGFRGPYTTAGPTPEPAYGSEVR